MNEPSGGVERYLLSGDRRLPRQNLEGIYREIGRSLKPSTVMLAADVCIDLAMVSNDPDEWIDTAESNLSALVDDHRDMMESGITVNHRQSVTPVSRAVVRLSELPSWRRAAHGDTQSPHLGRSLMAALQLDELYPGDEVARSRQHEFMPIILGQRAIRAAADQNGWYGRMALLREDCRTLSPLGANNNWDVGICTDPEGSDFASPSVRLQIGGSSKAGVVKYATAGIPVLKAKQLGFVGATNPIDYLRDEIKGVLREEDRTKLDKAVDLIKVFLPAT